jgi:choline dehydrogenase-like flavoprotein
MSDFDFQATSTDGCGIDWPLRYQDLAPYYDRVERFLGVTGTIERLPQLPDGIFLPAQPLESDIEVLLRSSAEQSELRLIPARITERPGLDSVQPCPHCGRINQGCHRYTSSVETTLAAALQTGRVELRVNTLVHRIIVNQAGLACGVSVIDKSTGERYDIQGQFIFLCASTLESTRILLNSRSEQHPHGIGNRSGVLGHYLTVHLYGAYVVGQVRVTRADRVQPLRQTRLLYIPRWQNLTQRTHPSFVRGYSYLVAVTPFHLATLNPPGCFNPEPSSANRLLTSDRYLIGFYPFGEAVPRYDNYVEIDRHGGVDAWGIPTLHIHYSYEDSDQAMARDMVTTATGLIRRAGGSIMKAQNYLTEPGLCVHEAGTCRMGRDPKTSVLNAYNQCHEVSNLFVVDGGAFPSLPSQNPTLTMMSLAVRACAYANQQIRAGMIVLHSEEE